MGTFLGVGNVIADRFAIVDDQFLIDNDLKKNTTNVSLTKEPIETTWEKAGNSNDFSLGGSSANVIKVLASLGNKTALIGRVGSDSVGKNLALHLHSLGVETFLTESNQVTGIANCFITNDRIRTMHSFFGSAYELCSNDLQKKEKIFNKANHIHLEGYLIYYSDVLQSSITIGQNNYKTISLDLSNEGITGDPILSEKMKSCIKQVNFIFGNLQEVLKLTNTNTPEAALASNIFGDHQIIVITNGGNDCFIKAFGKIETVELSPVDNVVDTTGAGDYFIGGFLHAFISKKGSVSQSALNGHLVASYVIQTIGTNLSSDTWKEVNSRLT